MAASGKSCARSSADEMKLRGVSHKEKRAVRDLTKISVLPLGSQSEGELMISRNKEGAVTSSHRLSCSTSCFMTHFVLNII